MERQVWAWLLEHAHTRQRKEAWPLSARYSPPEEAWASTASAKRRSRASPPMVPSSTVDELSLLVTFAPDPTAKYVCGKGFNVVERARAAPVQMAEARGDAGLLECRAWDAGVLSN